MPEVKRLQNHSCGQCRRSKKACDGFLINSGKDSEYTLICCKYELTYDFPGLRPQAWNFAMFLLRQDQKAMLLEYALGPAACSI